jgi:hypothetical protein
MWEMGLYSPATRPATRANQRLKAAAGNGSGRGLCGMARRTPVQRENVGWLISPSNRSIHCLHAVSVYISKPARSQRAAFLEYVSWLHSTANGLPTDLRIAQNTSMNPRSSNHSRDTIWCGTRSNVQFACRTTVLQKAHGPLARETIFSSLSGNGASLRCIEYCIRVCCFTFSVRLSQPFEAPGLCSPCPSPAWRRLETARRYF